MYARDVSTWRIKAADDAKFHWIATDDEDDRKARGRCFCCEDGRLRTGKEEGSRQVDQFCGKRRHQIIFPSSPSVLDMDVLAFGIAVLGQPSTKCCQLGDRIF